MRRNIKALKRHSEGHKGILIGPSMAPRFFRVSKTRGVFSTAATGMSASGPTFLGTDGKPTQPRNVDTDIVS